MQNHRQPLPGRIGTHPNWLASGIIGGTNYLGGAAPFTVNTTTIFPFGGMPYQSIFSRFCASATIVPADADGTILARVRKYRAATDDYLTLSNDIDLETLVTKEAKWADYISSLKDADLFIYPGDTLEVIVVNNSAAINTQPAGLVFNLELFQIK